MSKTNISHQYTNEIVCPFCKVEFNESWEYEPGCEDIGLIQCHECDNYFYANRNIEVTYSTEKAKYGTCKKCNKSNTVIEDYHSSIGSFTDLCIKCGEIEKNDLHLKAIK